MSVASETPLFITDPKDDVRKNVGVLQHNDDGSVTWYKRISPEHVMRLGAFGFDAITYDTHFRGKSGRIRLERVRPDGTVQNVYTAELAIFDKKARGNDYGHGRQYFLPFSHWTTEGDVSAKKRPAAGVQKPADDFITLKGKAYLPARRRIQWMRGGEPKPHPEWGIVTDIVQFERGERIAPQRVKGGYACVRATIYDTGGRVIATGTKTEWSENFGDFLEKAETGAIARALAVAGYGTETALDLDDGAEQERPADAPVEPPKPRAPIHDPHAADGVVIPTPAHLATRPVIAPSTAPSAAKGGRQHSANAVQVNEVFRLAREAHLALRGLVSSIAASLSIAPIELPEDDMEVARNEVVEWLEGMTADQLGTVISRLSAASAPIKFNLTEV